MPSSLCPRYCHVTVFELNRGPYVCAFVNAIPIILPCMIFSERLKSKAWWEFSHSIFVCIQKCWLDEMEPFCGKVFVPVRRLLRFRSEFLEGKKKKKERQTFPSFPQSRWLLSAQAFPGGNGQERFKPHWSSVSLFLGQLCKAEHRQTG